MTTPDNVAVPVCPRAVLSLLHTKSVRHATANQILTLDLEPLGTALISIDIDPAPFGTFSASRELGAGHWPIVPYVFSILSEGEFFPS
jgi:hypothetical protein